MSFRYGGRNLRDIWFTLADGSIAKTCVCSASCTNGTTRTLTATQSLVGLAIKYISTSGTNTIDASIPELSIWRDDNFAQCYECLTPSPTLSFETTIANKTYFVGALSVTTEAFRTNLWEPCFASVYTLTYKKDGTALGSSLLWLT